MSDRGLGVSLLSDLDVACVIDSLCSQKPSTADADMAWAAGLFEGEGCILARKDGIVGLSIAMTDRDVLERFREVVGAGSFVAAPARKEHWRTIHRLDIGRTADVLRILSAFAPFLGDRRRSRALEVLTLLDERVERVTQARRCPTCKIVFRPAFNRNSERRRYCSRDCMRRDRRRPRSAAA